MVRCLPAALAAGIVLAGAAAPVPASAAAPDPRPPGGPHSAALLAQATPEGCFSAIGEGAPPNADGGCPAGARPKTDQAAVSALARTGRDLWLGTEANTVCLVVGALTARLGALTPLAGDTWACEFGRSPLRASLPDPSWLPERLGDWRPPRIYRYRHAAEELDDLAAPLVEEHRARLDSTLAIHAAGAVRDTVLFAGPAVGAIPGGAAPGINLFAFDAGSGALRGSATLPGYTAVGGLAAAGGALYAAVGTEAGGGAILRWDGGVDPAGAPVGLTEVGTLPAPGATLVRHRDRLYAATAPGGDDGPAAGVHRTAPLGVGGLTTSTAPLEEVWSASDYEPDPVTASTYRVGALASFGGHLVWGTTHVPLLAAITHFLRHPDVYGRRPSLEQTVAVVGGTHRAAALFSARRPGEADPRVRLLYGNRRLPAYDEASGWRRVPNVAGLSPVLGRAGFGNPYNAAVSAMAATDHDLYVGTADWSQLASEGVTDLIGGLLGTELPVLEPDGRFGADLMRLPSLREPAGEVSRTGLDAPENAAIRTLVADRVRAYLGTASGRNLGHDAGWELHELVPGVSVQRRR